MTLTPEDRARRLWQKYIGRNGDVKCCWPGTVNIAKEIRLAVAAERRRLTSTRAGRYGS